MEFFLSCGRSVVFSQFFLKRRLIFKYVKTLLVVTTIKYCRRYVDDQGNKNTCTILVNVKIFILVTLPDLEYTSSNTL